MKWIGWMVAVMAGIACVAVHQNNVHEQSLLEGEIRKDKKVAAASVAAAERDMANVLRQLEKQLEQVKQKRAELLLRRQEADNERVRLTEQIDAVTAEVEKQEAAKSETRTARRDNLQEIRRLQAQVGGIMPEIEKLKEALLTVMEPADLAAEGAP